MQWSNLAGLIINFTLIYSCLFGMLISDMDGALSTPSATKSFMCSTIHHAANQTPAIIIMGFFYLLSGIPFGVSYFPIGWTTNADQISDATAEEHGVFPLPGKEAMGIRMFLFASLVGHYFFISI